MVFPTARKPGGLRPRTFDPTLEVFDRIAMCWFPKILDRLGKNQSVALRHSAPLLFPTACRFSAWFIALALTAGVALPLRADEPRKPTFSDDDLAFYRDAVEPILERRCYKCHGAEDKPKSGLRLTNREAVLSGGDLGPAVSLDAPEDSPLLTAIGYEELEMPPSGKLPQDEIDVLARWVRLGVPFPADRWKAPASSKKTTGTLITDESRNYWAYQPLRRPDVPAVQDVAWVHNPIDAFILHRLEANGLRPAPPADRLTLVRRVYYDLIGLPPTPEQIERFLADHTPQAYERLVDRLLASPHYGEKWGRHWLDLVRYAETNGYERDNPKPDVWRYRDYVIKSLNDDKPYDRFILEQLAGDELDHVTPESITATGYYRLGLWDDEPVDAEQAYYDSLDDVVSTTGQVFLGISIGCARCHDHKIDPIPQRDYYRLLAFFNNTLKDIRQLKFKKTAFTLNTTRVIATESEQQEHRRQVEAIKQRREQIIGEIAAYETRVFAALSEPEKEDARDDKVHRILLAKYRGEVLTSAEIERYDSLERQLRELKQAKAPPLPAALAIKENGPTAPPTHVLIRGSVHAPGDEVQPGFPTVLGFDDPSIAVQPDGAASCGRRLVLARWLIDPANPLTARVIANRLWQHHFGRGIVRTPNDFGKFGQRPTHPELLDWLASEMMARGWRLKAMHRLIMTSQAYRMASVENDRGLAQDPRNNLFWRFDLRRLTAEEVRDSVLATSGVLNLKLGGPSVYTELPQAVLATASRPDAAWGHSSPSEQARRSIYIHAKRSLAEPVLRTFDSADSESSCPVRFATTVPTQSLTMLNSRFFNVEAIRFARRVIADVGAEPAAEVDLALRLALCRPAMPHEVQRGVALIDQWQQQDGLTAEQALSNLCLMIFNLNEFVYLD